MPPAVPPRVVAALRTLHAAAAIVVGLALAATLLDRPRLALAAIVIVLFVQIFSIEVLRVLVLSTREPRR